MKFPIEFMGIKAELVFSKTKQNVTATLLPFGQSQTFSRVGAVAELKKAVEWLEKDDA